MNAPAGAPTPDTLRQIVERLEGAAHDLETALGLARRSGSLPVIRDNIRDAAEESPMPFGWGLIQTYYTVQHGSYGRMYVTNAFRLGG